MYIHNQLTKAVLEVEQALKAEHAAAIAAANEHAETKLQAAVTTAISEAEAQRTLAQMQESVDKPRPSIQFSIGEQIRVKDGPFASFNGTVETIDEESGKIRVSVSIFGRATPVELDFNQAEKAG